MTEQMQRRVVAHRLAVLQHAVEVTGNVSQTCQYYGISRATFYKWLRQYEEQGEQGLRHRSSRPFSSPRATSAEVVGKIMYLRQSYHFGPHKIAMYLKRYHELTISPSGVWRVFCRLDLSRLPSSQRHTSHQKRWKRYEQPQPGHRVQVDVKFITPVGAAGKKFYQRERLASLERQRQRLLRLYQLDEIDDRYLEREVATLRAQRTSLEAAVANLTSAGAIRLPDSPEDLAATCSAVRSRVVEGVTNGKLDMIAKGLQLSVRVQHTEGGTSGTLEGGDPASLWRGFFSPLNEHRHDDMHEPIVPHRPKHTG